MKIALASTSDVKLSACRKAFPNDEIIGIKAPSGVNEQPLNEETLCGAFNRINYIKLACPDADLYISIENGIFEESSGDYTDRAVVVARPKDSDFTEVAYSDGVVFPKDAVEETQKRGFDQWTVGKVMQEQGIVAQHDDPHLSLSGKSRTAYIDEALTRAKFQLGM